MFLYSVIKTSKIASLVKLVAIFEG